MLSSLAGLRYPVIINKTINNIAQTATPVALICIGASFEGKKVIKKIKPTVIATFLKLVGLAAIFLPIAVKMGFRNQELMAILIMHHLQLPALLWLKVWIMTRCCHQA